MRSLTAQWFETRVRYEKMMEDGSQKNVTELYVVDALSFSEAEKRVTEEMMHYVSGDFAIKTITPASYGEIFFSDADMDDRWFKAKLSFITIDEKTEKEKRTSVTKLVQGGSVQTAVKNVEETMKGSMIDYVIAGITETKIMDVFEHMAQHTPERDDKPEYEE